MDLSVAELAALESERQQIGVFMNLATTPTPVRLWLGIGKIEPGVNTIDLTGAAYSGFGELIDVPSVQQLINGTAERVEFRLSGVSEEILALAASEASTVKTKRCSLGIGIMDSGWRLLGAIHWMRHYRSDFLFVDETLVDAPGNPVVRTVVLSVGSATTGRRRPGLSYLTDQDQQRLSPGDRFCERTNFYSRGTSKVWPHL